VGTQVLFIPVASQQPLAGGVAAPAAAVAAATGYRSMQQRSGRVVSCSKFRSAHIHRYGLCVQISHSKPRVLLLLLLLPSTTLHCECCCCSDVNGSICFCSRCIQRTAVLAVVASTWPAAAGSAAAAHRMAPASMVPLQQALLTASFCDAAYVTLQPWSALQASSCSSSNKAQRTQQPPQLGCLSQTAHMLPS
jgi:hypothetical protein